MHVHVQLFCPHILERPQNIELRYPVVCFLVSAGIVVSVFESASVCFRAGFLNTCHHRRRLYINVHCKYCAFEPSTTRHQQQLREISLSLHRISTMKRTHTLTGSRVLVLLNSGNMLQAVYNIKWIYQRAPQHATKMYGMCVSNEGKLQAAVNWIHSFSNHCDGAYYPCMGVFKCARLSLANWGSLNGVHYPCTHVCLWPGLLFDQTNDRRATPQTITSHISETRGIHSPSPQDTFLLGTSLWQRQQASRQRFLWTPECLSKASSCMRRGAWTSTFQKHKGTEKTRMTHCSS